MTPLPSFENPPVTETVLGVQFDPLAAMRNAHLALFWKSLDADWTQIDEQPPLDPQFEEFPATWAAIGVQFRLTQHPVYRLRLKNTGGDRMVQIQNGRLHFNWMGGDRYPRYENIKAEFSETLAAFEAFAETESLGILLPNQWEVTYVNHIPSGELWEEPSEWQKVFPAVSGAGAKPSMLSLDSFAVNQRFEITPQRGRLYLEINFGRSKETGTDVIVAKLTARGAVAVDGLTLDAGLDLGREAIVRTFREITSEEAHKFWGLET
jgi:uncharacterized protein (TIGR04255 family)